MDEVHGHGHGSTAHQLSTDDNLLVLLRVQPLHGCRAGSSVAVPQLGERAACARGTDCPVYFQGVVILPGCDRSRGILLHNN